MSVSPSFDRTLPRLYTTERNRYEFTRFAGAKVVGSALRSRLDAVWHPWDVGDYGEVPHYTRYFETCDITARMCIDPRMNDHYPAAGEYEIKLITFSRGRIGNITQIDGLLKLDEVPDEIMMAVLAELCPLFAAIQ
ncbi:MAG: hypothetical protein KDK34_15620 [Leptospiraceae bacterium]|nr:hypothetical protein [Leptospiraceae bacterium]